VQGHPIVAAVVLLGVFGLVYLGLTAAVGVGESTRLAARLGLGRGDRRSGGGR
jgi:hypothetical protein